MKKVCSQVAQNQGITVVDMTPLSIDKVGRNKHSEALTSHHTPEIGYYVSTTNHISYQRTTVIELCKVETAHIT